MAYTIYQLLEKILFELFKFALLIFIVQEVNTHHRYLPPAFVFSSPQATARAARHLPFPAMGADHGLARYATLMPGVLKKKLLKAVGLE